ERIVAEAVLLERARRLVLGEHVGLLHHLEQHGLALRMLQVERDRLLVGVQREEVAAVHARLLGAAVAAGIALAGLLPLDDLGAQPGQELGAGGARLELGEVQHANAVEREGHSITPFAGSPWTAWGRGGSASRSRGRRRPQPDAGRSRWARCRA